MKFQRRSSPSSEGRGKPAVNLERKRQAEELAARSGIPLQMAYSIVDGRTTLDSVLKTMLARDKTKRLIEQYSLPPSLAGQVARGHVSLDKVLARHRRRSSPFWRAQFSIFDEIGASGQPVALLRFGSDWVEGRVTGLGKYDFTFDAGSGPESILKHEVKLLLTQPAALPQVRAAISADPTAQSRHLGATADLAERLKLDKEHFYEQIKEGLPVRFLLRDGDALRGPVTWFARYEFAVRLDEQLEVVGFFHALLDWTIEAPSGPEPQEQPADKDKARHKPHHDKGKKHKKGRR